MSQDTSDGGGGGGGGGDSGSGGQSSQQCQLANCKQCDSQGKCTTCIDGYYSQNEDQQQNIYIIIILIINSQCLKTCSDGYYASVFTCQICSSLCATCSTQSDNCISCREGYTLNGTSCVQTCNPGYFPQGPQCSLCDQMCATCSESSTKCQSCKDGFQLSNKTCVQTCSSGSCVKNCDNGYYAQGQNCLNCDGQCATCFGAGDSCLTCSDNLLLENNSCVQTCGVGYYQSDKKCLKCDNLCYECSELNHKCLSCNRGFLLQDNTCVKQCKTGYYATDKSCLNCDQKCATCIETSSNCLTCQKGLFLQENQCLDQCGTSYYVESNNCLKCHQSCLTCSGPSQNECLSCKKGLNSKKIGDLNFLCYSCDSSCSKCSGPLKTDCISCASGLIFQPTLKLCAQCEEGQFFNQSTNRCDDCFQDCLTCSGKQNTECIICNSGLIKSNFTKTCETNSKIQSEEQLVEFTKQIGCFEQDKQELDLKCNDEFEKTKSLTKIQDTLAIVCLPLLFVSSLFTPFGSTLGWVFIQDQQIIGNYIFSSKLIPLWMNQFELKMSYITCGQCDTTKGYYIDGIKCSQCDQSCMTCNNTTSSSCLTCKPNLYLYQNNTCGQCDTTKGYYIDGIKCSQCDQSCMTCNNTTSSSCLTCKPNLYLYQNNTCGQCDTSNGYYVDGFKCSQCDQSCLTCNNTTSSSCLTCKPNLYLYQNNTCQICNRESGYYIEGQYCKQCDTNCLTCDETPTKCLTCPINQYLLKNYTCTDSCDINKGYFIQDNQCLQCDASCLTCNGSSEEQCLTCRPNQFILNKNQIDKAGSCQSCDNSCAKCQGPTNKDCLTCSKSYILLPSLGKCALCEEGYFFNQNNCEQCNEMCLTCSGKNQNECIDCRGGLILSNITKTCQQSSQIQNELIQIEYSKSVGCYNQIKQQIDSSCLDQIQSSKSSTSSLDTLATINLSFIIASSLFTPIGSSFGWIFIQNQQLLGNYIFAYKLGPLWMNQFEMKMSYAHHLFTVIPNIFTNQADNEKILFQFKKFNTLFSINDFWNSYLNNCFTALLPFIESLTNQIIVLQEFLYLIIVIFISVILNQEYSTYSYEVTEININLRNAYRIAMYAYIGVSICIQAFILLSKAWNYIKMLKQVQNIQQNKNQTTTCNMVEQITDSNLDKIFEMLDQSKNKSKFGWKNMI
ncbi:hypothetical protein ABPG73_012330 [Tetrahymena malaccensis]